MQFTTIAAILSFAAMAVSSPVANLAERSETTPTCAQGQTVKCCNAVVPTADGDDYESIPVLENIGIGIGCVIPVLGGCLLNTQKQTCCSNAAQVPGLPSSPPFVLMIRESRSAN